MNLPASSELAEFNNTIAKVDSPPQRDKSWLTTIEGLVPIRLPDAKQVVPTAFANIERLPESDRFDEMPRRHRRGGCIDFELRINISSRSGRLSEISFDQASCAMSMRLSIPLGSSGCVTSSACNNLLLLTLRAQLVCIDCFIKN